MTHSKLVLGIDGGGTKTVCWLAPGADPHAVIGRGRSSASNPRAVGMEAARKAIDRAIDAAFDAAGVVRRPVAASAFGLAGAGRAEIQKAIADWAVDRRIAEQIRVVPDYELVLAAGAADGVGVALISGTGSLAFGRNEKGEFARAGGWGYLLSDEGSGFAIGRAAVRSVIEVFESGDCEDENDRDMGLVRSISPKQPHTDRPGPAEIRQPGTLEHGLLENFNAVDASQLVAAIYASDDPRLAVARIAPLVTQAAEEGDRTANNIVRRTATDLALLVKSVAERLGFRQVEFPLAVAGGVLTGARTIRNTLKESLDSNGLAASIVVVPEPTAGAIALAAEAAGGE